VLGLVGALWAGLALSGTVGCENTGGSKWKSTPMFGGSSTTKNDGQGSQGVGQPGGQAVMNNGGMQQGVGQSFGGGQQPVGWQNSPPGSTMPADFSAGRGAPPLPRGNVQPSFNTAPSGGIQPGVGQPMQQPGVGP